MQTVSLGRGGPSVSRIGLGMAALGRPAYITTGRAADFGEDRSEEAFCRRSWEVLEPPYAAGIRYLDCARSYGSAEAFVAGWLARVRPDDVVVGSKWGYTYVGGWGPAAGGLETGFLQGARARGRDLGRGLGITPSGPSQADPIRRALEIRSGGEPLFGAVQATWNLLEPSVEPALAEAAQAGGAEFIMYAVG